MPPVESSHRPRALGDGRPKQTPAKAIAAGLSTAVLTALTAYFTGSDDIDMQGVIAAVVSGVVGFGVTYAAPRNKEKAARDERGESVVVIGLAIFAVVVIAVLLVRGCDGDRDNDGKRGNDWEIHPVGSVV